MKLNEGRRNTNRGEKYEIFNKKREGERERGREGERERISKGLISTDGQVGSFLFRIFIFVLLSSVLRAGAGPCEGVAFSDLFQRFNSLKIFPREKNQTTEQHQLKILNQLFNLQHESELLAELSISDKGMQERLDLIIQNPEFSFSVRKKAFYVLINMSVFAPIWTPLYPDKLSKPKVFAKKMALFSPSEKKALMRVISRWKNAQGWRKEFITDFTENTLDSISRVGEHSPLAMSRFRVAMESPFRKLLDMDQMLIYFFALDRDEKLTNKQRIEVIQTLLKFGASPNSKGWQDNTILMTVIWRKDTDMVNLLLNAGADPNAQDKSGWTALMATARANSNKDTVKALLNAGADPNAQDKKGWTALMFAANDGHIEVVKELLSAGADPHITSHKSQIALLIAKEKGYAEIVIELINAGADPDPKGSNGRGLTSKII